MSEQTFIAIHTIIVEIFQSVSKWWIDRQIDVAIANRVAKNRTVIIQQNPENKKKRDRNLFEKMT